MLLAIIYFALNGMVQLHNGPVIAGAVLLCAGPQIAAAFPAIYFFADRFETVEEIRRAFENVGVEVMGEPGPDARLKPHSYGKLQEMRRRPPSFAVSQANDQVRNSRRAPHLHPEGRLEC